MRTRTRTQQPTSPKRGRRAFVALVTLAVVLSVCSLGSEGEAQARGTFKLIVHPDNALGSATRSFLSDAFLRNVSKWGDGRKIQPVDLRADSKVREHFSDRVHGRSVLAIKRFWQQRIFSGSGVPPPELDSDEAVLNYVLQHPGALGYVSADAAIGKARTLEVR